MQGRKVLELVRATEATCPEVAKQAEWMEWSAPDLIRGALNVTNQPAPSSCPFSCSWLNRVSPTEHKQSHALTAAPAVAEGTCKQRRARLDSFLSWENSVLISLILEDKKKSGDGHLAFHSAIETNRDRVFKATARALVEFRALPLHDPRVKGGGCDNGNVDSTTSAGPCRPVLRVIRPRSSFRPSETNQRSELGMSRASDGAVIHWRQLKSPG